MLLSAGEIEEYLCFRTKLIEVWGEELNKFTEKALVGQYIGNVGPSVQPSEEFQFFVDQVLHEVESWDMSGILHNFFERIYESGNYYAILRELAKLHRNELKLIKERFKLSMDKAIANEFAAPYRVVIPRTGCGFVFIPTEQDLKNVRHRGLENFTLLHKYEQKIDKCIGVCFVGDGGEWCLVDWCYIEEPWSFDEQIEQSLQRSYPFREVKQHLVPRYKFEK